MCVGLCLKPQCVGLHPATMAESVTPSRGSRASSDAQPASAPCPPTAAPWRMRVHRARFVSHQMVRERALECGCHDLKCVCLVVRTLSLLCICLYSLCLSLSLTLSLSSSLSLSLSLCLSLSLSVSLPFTFSSPIASSPRGSVLQLLPVGTHTWLVPTFRGYPACGPTGVDTKLETCSADRHTTRGTFDCHK